MGEIYIYVNNVVLQKVLYTLVDYNTPQRWSRKMKHETPFKLEEGQLDPVQKICDKTTSSFVQTL